MAKNDFKPFATGAGANVMSQADWEALIALSTGFQSGKASSAQMNKAFRQGTVMASVLAQFISDLTAADVLDNGNTANILLNLKSAVNKAASGRLVNIQVFPASATWTKTAGTLKARIKVWGAGGGGANTGATAPAAAASGSGGGYAEGYFDVSAVTSLPVIVGSGGASVAANTTANGGNGGASSVGTLISATGGAGGGATPAGGVGTNGNIMNFSGQLGQGGASTSLGGTGGASYGSYGGLGHSASAGDDGGFPGGGGAGGSKPGTSTYFASGKGANGYVIIEEYA